MTNKKFNQILQRVLHDVEATLGAKNADYARNGDRLHNFKEAARLDQITTLAACIGMQLKHRTSMQDIRADLLAGKVIPLEKFLEKMIDEFNYNILLLALATENNQIEE